MPSAHSIQFEDTVRAADSQVSSRLGDEVAILELDRGVYFGLNPSGAHLWDALQKPVAVSALHASMIAEYEVDDATARNDLLKMLEQLRAAGLIEICEAHAD
jgi:Coenzyme PQQ synthesis protein D (PqqD)